MVVGEGFEPSKLSQQIYSLPPLTARESHQKRSTIIPTAGDTVKREIGIILQKPRKSKLSTSLRWFNCFLFFFDDADVFGVQLVVRFWMLLVYQDAVDGADLLALGFVVMSDALGAEVWIDFVDFLALRDGIVGAFRFADVAVDTLIGNEERHGESFLKCVLGILSGANYSTLSVSLLFFICLINSYH